MGPEERDSPEAVKHPGKYWITVYTRVESSDVPFDPKKPWSLGGVGFGADTLPTNAQVNRVMEEIVEKWRK